MLYIDEPNQVGLSYDVPTNCTVFLTDDGNERIEPSDFPDGSDLPQLNLTTRIGTFSSQNASNTANGTAQAAHALWHFAQTFFTEFPHYKPRDDKISLWAESYGGHYGPAFMRFFQLQNEKIANGTIEEEHAHYLHLDTLGIVNGYLDALIQEEAYISFPFNNVSDACWFYLWSPCSYVRLTAVSAQTYGIQHYNQSVYEELLHNFTRQGGCKAQLAACQDRLRGSHGTSVVTKHRICDIEEWCREPSESYYLRHTSGGWFDIAHPRNDPFPPPHLLGYLMQDHVLAALGSPVNFTSSSPVVSGQFDASFDSYAGGFVDDVGYLLDHGVKVHMMYGDRDYACNWVGGEAVSLAIPYSRAKDFADAGYSEFVTHEGVGGRTRQFGNHSFTRVYQAGHEVPSYQPFAAYEIFMRATFNRDIATGMIPVTDELATTGPKDTWQFKNEPPKSPKPKCYVLNPGTCDSQTWRMVVAGNVTVKDYFVVAETATSNNENGVGDDEL